ncbi:Beta-site APP-cleaving enzyme [Asimina triloba]
MASHHAHNKHFYISGHGQDFPPYFFHLLPSSQPHEQAHNGMEAVLIRRDSPLSPSYNPSAAATATASEPGSAAPTLASVKGQEEFYYLSLDGISVGNDRLPLREGVFHADDDGKGGFMIDSGTIFTYLARAGFNTLIKALEEFKVLPRDADVVLTKKGSYTEADDGMFCLAMFPTTGVSLMGNMAQQNYIVGYDLNKAKVSFASMDCTKFQLPTEGSTWHNAAFLAIRKKRF